MATDMDMPAGKDAVTVRLIQHILDMPEDRQLSLLHHIETTMPTPRSSGERESRRQPYVNEVEFQAKGKTCTGISKNISTDGIFIKTDEPLSVGQTILLNIPFTNKNQIIRVPAHVVRTTHEGAGVAFLRSE